MAFKTTELHPMRHVLSEHRKELSPTQGQLSQHEN